MIWFELEDKKNLWKVRKIHDVTFKDDEKERVVECIMYKDNVMLLVMRQRIIVMREDFVTLGTVDFKNQLGAGVNIVFCRPDHPTNKNGLLIGFFASDSAAKSPKFNLNANGYEGSHPGNNTLVARFSFDKEKKQVKRSSTPNDAVLLRSELANSALEFTPKKILIATHSSKLLLFEDWNCVRVLSDPNPANFTRINSAISTLRMLPGFH